MDEEVVELLITRFGGLVELVCDDEEVKVEKQRTEFPIEYHVTSPLIQFSCDLAWHSIQNYEFGNFEFRAVSFT